MRERSGSMREAGGDGPPRLARDCASSACHLRPGNFSVGVSLAGIEPEGLRVKSDLRNHQAIVQPRLYDCLMVTQIALNTEPLGLDSCQGHSDGKVAGA